jgi:p-hydroxybenzoate 3-monooxygenase
MRTQVAIIGAGPAGLFLALLLRKAGVDCIVLEKRERAYVEGRVRAGVLEQVTTDLMERLGVGARMRREGLVHRGVNLAVDGDMFHIDFADLADGAAITVYGQSEVMKDVHEEIHRSGLSVIYGAQDVALHGLDGETPSVTWSGGAERLECDFIAGCDGYHGASRAAIPELRAFERVYPFGWLGILADAPPCEDELVYANHENGFALASMRSPTRSRYYIQCGRGDAIGDWPDDRFWDELCLRLGPSAGAKVTRAPSLEKSIAPLRSFVCETMRYGPLFLAGDAAHIVPPTGAKGLNLAVADVIYLCEAVSAYYRTGAQAGLDFYAARALARVWKAERFSWWLTMLTHRFPHMDGFDRKMQVAELDYIKSSRAAQTVLAENYVGLPLEPAPV